VTGSLVVVGAGYRVAGRITTEAATEITTAESVFYLVYDWLDEGWLRRIRPDAVSLADYLKPGQSASRCCGVMVRTIMKAVRQGHAVCVAFPGHPSICVNPTRTAFEIARAEGFPARMIPGVSVLDCLFADLCLDPTAVSCRVFDATRFLIGKHSADRSSGLVLLQVARIGGPPLRTKDRPERRGLKMLRDVLVRDYGPLHKVIHYQTSLSPFSESTIEETPVSYLLDCDIRFKSTLYVPPVLS
jgi:hypothetical protein